MRLIHARTGEIVEFPNEEVKYIPEYAILSHTWEAGEVSYQDYQDWQDQKIRAFKKGFLKIRSTREQAVKDKIDWVWIDTCCINKWNSTELSEAINSMFRWYRNAKKCYAYLFDVQREETLSIPLTFEKSKWFTRGWTLQELLAPNDVVFFSSDWTELGSRRSLSRAISKITGISEIILDGYRSLSSVSVAQKMSWASDRVTTKPEDIAYCLLGTFGISMPLLYGEGDRAFLRLQEEIIKVSPDQSILAWERLPSWCWWFDKGGERLVDYEMEQQSYSSRNEIRYPFTRLKSMSVDSTALLLPPPAPDDRTILAPDPVNFFRSHDVETTDAGRLMPFSMTNIGLSIRLHLIPIQGDRSRFFAALQCTSGALDSHQLYIPVIRTTAGSWVRSREPKRPALTVSANKTCAVPPTRMLFVTGDDDDEHDEFLIYGGLSPGEWLAPFSYAFWLSLPCGDDGWKLFRR
ncbi:hypothetical protein SAPIO_CDS5682 [Scedosporium apiospermum]|uniref:Uncharacterized protein n=1 Tax=Pseudallescheria apiosperma TaxID=563466 RepID=A0A084G563_PSEDA|nr:uncharacterized protein SAPIO_CDS5682 [Scedosporium apiospermum]KEZ42475.1 hypothetical protein SAPIO_CDS5682 [Scedosporium apiospermum]